MSLFPQGQSIDASKRGVIPCRDSLVVLEEERKYFAPGLSVLEPRPLVYWSSVEERMRILDERLPI